MSEETPEYGMRSGEVSKEESEALMKGRFTIIAPLGDRIGYGTFETFWNIELYRDVDEAYAKSDCVVVNFVQDKGGKMWFHFNDLAEPEHQVYYSLLVQEFNPDLGIDTRDDNAAVNIYNKKFKNKTYRY